MIKKIIGLCRNSMRYTEGKVRPATEAEKYLGLQLKLYEEVGEVCGDMKNVEEYADVLQVLIDLAYVNGIDRHAIETARLHKVANKGNFIVPPKLWINKDADIE